MTTSEIEQEVACNSTLKASSIWNEVLDIIKDPRVSEDHKVKLAMVFAVRFERDGETVSRLISELIDSGVPLSKTNLVRQVLDFGGKGFFNRASSAVKGLKGVDNVYTQHQPLIS